MKLFLSTIKEVSEVLHSIASAALTLRSRMGVSPGIHEIPSNCFFNLTKEMSSFQFSKLTACVTLETSPIPNLWLIHNEGKGT
jgi:hypothetical protein